MRLVFVLLLVVFACDSPSEIKSDVIGEWSEEQKRQYFKDSIAYRMYNGRHLEQSVELNNVDHFLSQAYGFQNEEFFNASILYALEEPFLDTNELIERTFLRITVDPTFLIPYCVILEQTSKGDILKAKMTDGYGGYFSGCLEITVQKNVSDSLVNAIFNDLDSLDFFSLPKEIEENGSDGESWTIELVRVGKYHALNRWSPNHVGDTATRQIGKIGSELLVRSGLIDYWYLHGESPLQNDSTRAFKDYVKAAYSK